METEKIEEIVVIEEVEEIEKVEKSEEIEEIEASENKGNKTLLDFIKIRVHNYGFWMSLAAFIPLAFQLFGNVEILPKNYDEIVNSILALLVTLGICSNPTTQSKFFLDDKCECGRDK